MELQQILTKLCAVPSVSGAEDAVFKIVSEILPSSLSIAQDNMGNILINGGKGQKKILLDAHCDQIGFIVTGICNNGFLRVAPVGGIDARTLIGSRVTVLGKQQLSGIFSSVPPHLQKDGDSKKFPNIEELAVDIGLSYEKATEAVSLGDFAVVQNTPVMLSENRYCAAALDNKAGCAVLLCVMDKLFSEGSLKNTSVTLMLSTQEEVGMRGARAALPKADEVICVDASFASFPGCSPEQVGILGKGPMLGHSPVLSKKLTNELCALAGRLSIPLQHEVMGSNTGTNADMLSLVPGGTDCALISLPLRNMHSAAEIIDFTDLDACIRLIEAHIREVDAQ